MPHTVNVTDLQAWAEQTKLPITVTTDPLLDHIEQEILARLNAVADTTAWVDRASTPPLIRAVISKMYVAWLYRRQYSESLTDDDAAYAARLEANAEMIIGGLLDGTIEVDDVSITTVQPSFYPNDASSALSPTSTDRSLGDAKFSMGQVF